jgi:hypothetical protein
MNRARMVNIVYRLQNKRGKFQAFMPLAKAAVSSSLPYSKDKLVKNQWQGS